MAIKSPYLEAIQSIAGTTPGEKHKTIHAIARQLARVESDGNGDSEDSENPVPDVPEPLKPLVRVEVAKILHRYEGIIEALQSDDPVVVSRAVQAKWFFDGSNTALINAQYLCENLFPKISMYARIRMIKTFADHLKNTSFAAEFFIAVTELYGVDQALPLLTACDEEFAFNAIVGRKIKLSLRQVEVFYRKYPNLVIKYLKYENPDADGNLRNAYHVGLAHYIEFLPQLSAKHLDEFMEIYEHENNSRMDIKLCKKAASKFLKTRQNLLIEKPSRYLKLLPLEKVTKKLSNENFINIFKTFFPDKKSSFSYNAVNNILKYYKPAEDKIPLILRTFREIYGEDLLDNPDLVDQDLMKVLAAADRVKVARLKLEKDKDWHIYSPDLSWRCYLPTSESIPLITKEIVKSSNDSERQRFMQLLINTCQINNDKDALLKVLNNIYDKHKNEASHVFIGYLGIISRSFDLEMLGSAHWEVLNKCIKFIEVKGELMDRPNVMIDLTQAGIFYCLWNDLPMDYYLRIYVDLKAQRPGWYSDTFKKYPQFGKKVLDIVIEEMSKKYPHTKDVTCEEIEVVHSLMSSLWDYNERNRFRENDPNRLSIKDYPWLFDRVKRWLFVDVRQRFYHESSLLKSIKENEADIYNVWIFELPEFWTFTADVMYDILRKRPKLIFDNWKECLKIFDSQLHTDSHYIRFIKKIRWYQDLPIIIFNDSLGTCKSPAKIDTDQFFFLSILTDGKTYTKIIEPFIPVDEKIDIEHAEAVRKYEKLKAVTTLMPKVNPPVALDTIAKFCVGDYLKLSLGSLFSVSSRVPVSDVMPFIKTLMNRRVSVKKHGIRLIGSVAPLEELYTVLSELWKTEGHPSIRNVIFGLIYDIFCKQADFRSWSLFRTCLISLNVKDDHAIFKSLPVLSNIPDEYLHDYIKTGLGILKSVEEKSEDPNLFIILSYDFIRSIDRLITDILPEEYSQELIKKYLFVFEYNDEIFNIGKNLAIKSYLLVPGKHYESRYKFFREFFRDTVRKYWDKPNPKSPYRYPINYMVNQFFHTFIDRTTSRKYDVRIFENLLEIFNSVLQPHQDITTYLRLVYSVCFHGSNDLTSFSKSMVNKIPELIDALSPELIVFISEELFNFVKDRTDGKKDVLNFIEIFANSGEIRCAFIAANMLLKIQSDLDDEQWQAVLHALRNFHHPAISTLINRRLIT